MLRSFNCNGVLGGVLVLIASVSLGTLAYAASPPVARPPQGSPLGDFIVQAFPIPTFRGDQAALVLESTGQPPANFEGEMKLGDIIALHSVRAADSIVLLQTAKGRRREVPVGTVLSKVRFAQGEHPDIWCDVRPTGRFLYAQEHDCFEDTHNSGRLDKIWEGDSEIGFSGFAQSGVGDFADKMPDPVAYRVARPEERPTASLGFKYCAGDGIRSPPQFAAVLKPNYDSTVGQLASACRYGEWADPNDHSSVNLGLLRIKAAPTSDRLLSYVVLSPIPAGVLGPLEYSKSLVMAVNYPGPLKERQARNRLRSIDLFSANGAPPNFNIGLVAVGQLLLTVSVKHTISGITQNQVQGIDVGQPVFAIPGQSLDDDDLEWCAPHKVGEAFRVNCLYPADSGFFLREGDTPAMAPQVNDHNWFYELVTRRGPSQRIADQSNASSPLDYQQVEKSQNRLIVKKQPIDLPPMTLSLKLTNVTTDNAGIPAKVFHVDFLLDWGEGEKLIDSKGYQAPKQGRAFDFFGSKVIMRPSDDGTELRLSLP